MEGEAVWIKSSCLLPQVGVGHQMSNNGNGWCNVPS